MFHSPDLNKLHEVIIDSRTKIYIAIDAAPEQAKHIYITRLESKNKAHARSRRPIVI
jgi:hypothetical protein